VNGYLAGTDDLRVAVRQNCVNGVARAAPVASREVKLWALMHVHFAAG
jgi:hypothetical protein